VSLFLILTTSTLATLALIVLARSLKLDKLLLDRPGRVNAMHSTPVARSGGIFIGLGVIANLLWQPIPQAPTWQLLSLAAALWAASLLDDIFQLPPWLRLVLHIGAAVACIALWLDTSLANSAPFKNFLPLALPASAILFVLAITWSTNLYNFMDGADGLAGGMAVIGFGAYAIAASQTPTTLAVATEFAQISAIISGAALGFLIFNFPPAKVFMGDAGSIPLGFLAATLGIQGYFSAIWPWWFPLIVFSPFIVDATVTLLKRIAKREKIWLGHRQHAYQRLILSGWSHRKTALTYYALMVACAGSAIFACRFEATLFIISSWVIIYGLLIATTEIYLTRQNKKKSEPL
jgi:UDP-GlcNAc:undecaprenyl-phosphate/decaprenyl-phosphate GlcNAc-1-phosphate transferase